MTDNKFKKDLTTGNVWSQLIIFAIPFFVSNLIQSIYSVADMIILGTFCGENSISAVSTSSQVIVIVTNIAMGLSTGGTVMIGQYLGAKQEDKINKSISTLLITLFSLAVSITAILLFFTTPILNLMNTPIESYKEAKDYLIICLSGLIFVYGYNALSAIMRGLGDSKTPLKFISIASVTNIALDFLFVGYYEKGAAGAALATIIAQALSVILCIIYLKKHNFVFDFKISSFKFDKSCFKVLLGVGMPSAIQLVATNFSFLILTSLINDIGGVTAGAAAGIVNKFNGFAILPSVAITSSVSAMISQNMGAKKYQRVKQATRYGLILSCCLCAIVFTIVHIFPDEIFMLFGAEKHLIYVGKVYLFAFSFEYVFLPFIIGFNAVFTGTGNGWITMINDITSAFLVRIPLALFLGFSLDMGLKGIGYSIPAATCLGAIMAIGFYLSGIWKKNKVVN
ncbi:MAG: MATE family efflux transporter [Lachnospiraceae bacterium]|nr:MATE family efflux transporter [Lachnospiraceae bacterium]